MPKCVRWILNFLVPLVCIYVWSCLTCMHCTLPPLLAMEVMSLLVFLVGKPAMDLRPVNGATMPAPARLTVVTAGEEIIEEAICFSFLVLNYLFFCCQISKLLLKLAIYKAMICVVLIQWCEMERIGCRKVTTVGLNKWWHYSILATRVRKILNGSLIVRYHVEVTRGGGFIILSLPWKNVKCVMVVEFDIICEWFVLCPHSILNLTYFVTIISHAWVRWKPFVPLLQWSFIF